MSLFFKINRVLCQIQGQISRALELPQPALAYAVVPHAAESHLPDSDSRPQGFLESLKDSFLWAAVPKNRRSADRRRMRRFGKHAVEKFMTPKKNIVACLECGHWHEVHTICGNCYSKVREETEAMQAAMGEHDRLYNHPQSELAFIYKDESDQKPMYKGKHIVEVDKPRPEWFSKNLLTKGHGRY